MNKLNETSTAQPRLLSDAELTQVVGGRGHHRRWGNHRGNQSRNGNRGNGNGRGSNRPVIILIINDNDTTIINNTTFLS